MDSQYYYTTEAGISRKWNLVIVALEIITVLAFGVPFVVLLSIDAFDVPGWMWLVVILAILICIVLYEVIRRTAVQVVVDDTELHARLWPWLKEGVSVPVDKIRSVEVVPEGEGDVAGIGLRNYSGKNIALHVGGPAIKLHFDGGLTWEISVPHPTEAAQKLSQHPEFGNRF